MVGGGWIDFALRVIAGLNLANRPSGLLALPVFCREVVNVAFWSSSSDSGGGRSRWCGRADELQPPTSAFASSPSAASSRFSDVGFADVLDGLRVVERLIRPGLRGLQGVDFSQAGRGRVVGEASRFGERGGLGFVAGI